RLAVEEEAGVEAGPPALRRFEVVEGEAGLGGEGAGAVGGGVDEPAAVLGGLPGGEIARGPAAPTDPRPVRLMERAGDAALVEPIGAGEPGEPGGDDRDPGLPG